MEKIKICLQFLSILVSISTLVYTIIKNKSIQTIKKQVQEVQLDVIKASELYGQVKQAKKEYENEMARLTVTMGGNSEEEKKSAFLCTYNRYTDFFNEVNDFCIMVNVGAIKDNEYIKNTIAVNLSKYAKLQYETFSELQSIAKQINIEPIVKPDYNAFIEYDNFLKKYNNGDKSAFWVELKTKRRDAGFEN